MDVELAVLAHRSLTNKQPHSQNHIINYIFAKCLQWNVELRANAVCYCTRDSWHACLCHCCCCCECRCKFALKPPNRVLPIVFCLFILLFGVAIIIIISSSSNTDGNTRLCCYSSDRDRFSCAPAITELSNGKWC